MTTPLGKTNGIELVCGFEQWQIDALTEERYPSIEQFIEDLEDQLDRGEITMADVELAIMDFHHCK